MLEPNAIMIMMIVSFLIGLITNLVSQNVRFVVSIVGSLPLIIFLISSFISGTKIDDITEISDWLTLFLTNLIPLLLLYVAAGVGVGLVTSGRRTRRN